MQDGQHSQGFCILAHSPGVGLHIQLGNNIGWSLLKKKKKTKLLKFGGS